MAKADVPSINDPAPDATVLTADGDSVQLASYLEARPVLLLLYRGWW